LEHNTFTIGWQSDNNQFCASIITLVFPLLAIWGGTKRAIAKFPLGYLGISYGLEGEHQMRTKVNWSDCTSSTQKSRRTMSNRAKGSTSSIVLQMGFGCLGA
jgi:hypothetical protein